MRESADFNVEDFESRTAGDKSVYAKFFIRPFRDEEASAEQGRPIYRDREYIEIRAPGNQNNVVIRPVTEMDKQRFRPSYQAFKAGDLEQDFGTPLTEVPWITRSQVEELAYIKVRTLEHLANLGDDVCLRIPGTTGLKNKAKIAMERAERNAPFEAMKKENDDLKEQLASLKQAVEEQAAQLKAMKNTEKAAK